jgi:membrane fusion protein (multidrug efflux system)
MMRWTSCLLSTVLSCALLPLAGAQTLMPSTALPPNKSTRVVVQSLMQATLSAEIAARIVQLPWRDGDSFKKGDTLVAFDCAIFEAQRDKVGAELKAANAKLENDRALERTRSIGALEVVLSEVSVSRAQAEMRMAQINTDRCVIQAPWAGRILQRRAQELEVAKLHQEVLSIVSTDALEVMAVVPGQWVRSLKPGQTFEVRIDETGSRHTAEVVALGSQVDAVSQTINVRARIARDARLLPGMTGTAHVR